MGDSQIERIMLALDDIQRNQLDIRERLTTVETLIKERSRTTAELKETIKGHEIRISELEAHKHLSLGAKELLAFAIMAGLALWGVLK